MRISHAFGVRCAPSIPNRPDRAPAAALGRIGLRRCRHPDSTQGNEAPNKPLTGLIATMPRIGARADCEALVETSPVGVVVFDAYLSGE